MNQARQGLETLQRWTQAVITHPAGITAGIASEEARQNIDVSSTEVENVVTRSAQLTGAQRLAIYGRAYHARLMECFEVEYPCLLHFLGSDLFRRFVIEYLQAFPPNSYTLSDLSGRFPAYLAETRPDTTDTQDERNPWLQFVVDLATLERAFCEVYDGPGVENRKLPCSADLAKVSVSHWPAMRITPIVCLRLLSFSFPVQHYFTSVRNQQNPALPGPNNTYVGLTRHDYRVYIENFSATEFALLTALSNRLSVGDALQQVGEQLPAPIDDLQPRAYGWLREWADRGFFDAVET